MSFYNVLAQLLIMIVYTQLVIATTSVDNDAIEWMLKGYRKVSCRCLKPPGMQVAYGASICFARQMRTKVYAPTNVFGICLEAVYRIEWLVRKGIRVDTASAVKSIDGGACGCTVAEEGAVLDCTDGCDLQSQNICTKGHFSNAHCLISSQFHHLLPTRVLTQRCTKLALEAQPTECRLSCHGLVSSKMLSWPLNVKDRACLIRSRTRAFALAEATVSCLNKRHRDIALSSDVVLYTTERLDLEAGICRWAHHIQSSSIKSSLVV